MGLVSLDAGCSFSRAEGGNSGVHLGALPVRCRVSWGGKRRANKFGYKQTALVKATAAESVIDMVIAKRNLIGKDTSDYHKDGRRMTRRAPQGWSPSRQYMMTLWRSGRSMIQRGSELAYLAKDANFTVRAKRSRTFFSSQIRLGGDVAHCQDLICAQIQ